MSATALAALARETPATVIPVIRRVALEGNQHLSQEDLMKRVTLKPGKPLRRDQLRFSQGVLESTYRDQGYYEVHVATVVTTVPPNGADVLFKIEEGDLFRLGEIQVEGNRVISREVILRNLEVKTGEVFSQSKIFESNRQLYMTGYFDAIGITYSTTSAHTVDMRLKVKERATRYAKGAVGYGTQTKERVTLGFEDNNFLGNARKLDVSGTYSGFLTEPDHYRTTILQTTLTQPYIFGTRFEAQSNVSREWDDREPYDSVATAWRSSVGRRFGSAITASMRYRYQGTRVTRVNPLADTPGFTNISAVGPTFTYDNTNDPFLPTIGWRINGTYEEGVRFFAGDVRFHKLETRTARFDSFGQWTLYEDVQAGLIKPDSTSDRDIIPIYERYFAGGANTVRGYSERELGPRDPTGAPLGGDSFLVFNLEIRHRLYKKLYGVTFLDAGQLYQTDPGHVWPHSRFETIDDMRYATGFGVRLNSPVGAIRLEFGYKLNPQGGTSFLDRTAIHFSIGEIF